MSIKRTSQLVPGDKIAHRGIIRSVKRLVPADLSARRPQVYVQLDYLPGLPVLQSPKHYLDDTFEILEGEVGQPSPVYGIQTEMRNGLLSVVEDDKCARRQDREERLIWGATA